MSSDVTSSTWLWIFLPLGILACVSFWVALFLYRRYIRNRFDHDGPASGKNSVEMGSATTAGKRVGGIERITTTPAVVTTDTLVINATGAAHLHNRTNVGAPRIDTSESPSTPISTPVGEEVATSARFRHATAERILPKNE